MNNNEPTVQSALLGLGFLIGLILLTVAIWWFYCFCNKRICEKCGVTPGFLIWVPFFNLIPLLRAAQLSGWLILLMLVPVVGWIIINIMLCVKLCQARGKGVLAMLLVLLLPVIGFPYLAFSE